MSASTKTETILAGLLALLERGSDGVIVQTDEDAKLLVVGGQPTNGSIIAYGPFVMNTSRKIQSAVTDLWTRRFGQLG